MQRVEDFSELFRLKQSRQKNAKQAMKKQFWRIYSPRLFTNKSPSSSREREREKNEEETDRKPFPRFPRTPTGGPLDGSKIWMS